MIASSEAPRLVSIFLSIALLFAAGTAVAGPDKAREIFKEAKTAYNNGEYERAAELLEKAYSEEANLTYQYNRVRALQGAEQYEKALEVLNTYEKPMLDAKGFEDVPDLKRALEQKVGETPDSDTAAEEQTSEEEAVAGPAESMTEPSESAGPDPETGSEPADTKQQSDTASPNYLGWGLVGVGAASVGIGTLYASTVLLPSETKQRIDNDEPLTSDDDSTIQRQRTLSIVFWSVGAGALIGGGALLLTQGSGDGETDTTARRDDLRVTPWISGEAGGARLHLRF